MGTGGAHADSALPAAAKRFVGEWKHKRSEGYGAFLADCVGLSLLKRKVFNFDFGDYRV
jgi:hypothetical protein